MSSLRDRHAGKVAYATISAAKEAGHGRVATPDDDEKETAPRVPIIGVDSGCIPGTAPGCSAKALEQAGREIIRSRMALARKRLKQGGSGTIKA